jgi:rhamnulose-1-phosphate aldolase
MGVSDAALAGEHFIATGSGKHFRNVKRDPPANIGIVEINPEGNAWRIVWGLEGGAVPTSEFPSHFLNHAVRLTASNGRDHVIYHAHPPNLIALTYVLPLNGRDFTRVLWQSATECCVVFPEGVGVIPWMIPGGADIALATSKAMKSHSAVVWPHHGLFCSGADFDETLGLMNTIENAAKIFVKAQSTGLKTLSTITDDNLRAIAAAFNITLNESFLN